MALEQHKNNRVLVVDDQAEIHNDFIEMLTPNPRDQSTDALAATFIEEVDTFDFPQFEILHATGGREACLIVFGRSPIPVEAMVEISLGEWEGQMWADLEAAGKLGGYPADGNDIRRGHTGETWSDVQQRVSGFVNRLHESHPGGRVAVASHGGAIRAYAGSVLGFGFDKARLIGFVGNTAVTQVVASTDGKPAIATYNVTTHLEGGRAG